MKSKLVIVSIFLSFILAINISAKKKDESKESKAFKEQQVNAEKILHKNIKTKVFEAVKHTVSGGDDQFDNALKLIFDIDKNLDINVTRVISKNENLKKVIKDAFNKGERLKADSSLITKSPYMVNIKVHYLIH